MWEKFPYTSHVPKIREPSQYMVLYKCHPIFYTTRTNGMLVMSTLQILQERNLNSCILDLVCPIKL